MAMMSKSSSDDDGILAYYRVRKSKRQSNIDEDAGDTDALLILTFLALHGPTPQEKIQAGLNLDDVTFESALKGVLSLKLVEPEVERPDVLALTERGRLFASTA